MSCKFQDQKIQSVCKEWLEEEEGDKIDVTEVGDINDKTVTMNTATDSLYKNISECVDIPEDLSVNHRTVSVQTETCLQDKFEEICEGFTKQQIRSLMNVLVQFVLNKDNVNNVDIFPTSARCIQVFLLSFYICSVLYLSEFCTQ